MAAATSEHCPGMGPNASWHRQRSPSSSSVSSGSSSTPPGALPLRPLAELDKEEYATAIKHYVWQCYSRAAMLRRRAGGPAGPAASLAHLLARQDRRVAGAAALASVPEGQRAQQVASKSAKMIGADLEARGKCARCAFLRTYCICAQLGALAEEVARLGVEARVRFVVWMHVRERKRASNTGKLLEQLMPGSTVLFHSVPADLDRFRELVAGRGAFVLFPSADAIPAAALVARRAAAVQHSEPAVQGAEEREGGGSAAADALAAAPAPLLAVLVDGTWRQARRMHKHLEDLPRVALAPRAASEFQWRRQSQEDRISTVEAAALLLEDLCEPPEAARALRLGLRHINEALERQCHYDTLDLSSLPQRSARRRMPPHRLLKRVLQPEQSGAPSSDRTAGL